MKSNETKVIHFEPDLNVKYNKVFRDNVIELFSDVTESLQEDRYGKQIFGAVILISEDHQVLTAYAGRAHHFTTLGALQSMMNRIERENGEEQ